MYYKSNGSNRIPKEQVIKTNATISINDHQVEEEEQLLKTVVQKEIDASVRRIREVEQQVKEDMQKRKEAYYEQMAAEIKEEAVQEALLRLKQEQKEEQEAYKQMVEEVNQEKKAFFDAIQANLHHYTVEHQKNLYQLALEMAKEIVHRELEVDEGMMETYLRQALEKVSRKTSIVSIRVHPQVLRYIREQNPQGYLKDILLLGDADLALSDVVVETEREYIDLGIQTKIAQIHHWVEKLGGIS